MMSDRTYYVLCEDNCRFESMTKEQILAAITQAVEDHEIADVDTGFVTTVKEINGNTGLKFWVGTQAQYNALDPKPVNTFCIITDDTTMQDLTAMIDGKADANTTINGYTLTGSIILKPNDIGITHGTAAPSGGENGDIYIQHA